MSARREEKLGNYYGRGERALNAGEISAVFQKHPWLRPPDHVVVLDGDIHTPEGTAVGMTPLGESFIVLSEIADAETAIHECQTANTFVSTIDGIKPIHKIEPGDRVLSYHGHYHRVKERKEFDYQGRLIRIGGLCNNKPLEVTPNHPIYVMQRERMNEMRAAAGGRELTGLVQSTATFRWVRAEQISISDYMVIDVPQETMDYETIDLMFQFDDIICTKCGGHDYRVLTKPELTDPIKTNHGAPLMKPYRYRKMTFHCKPGNHRFLVKWKVSADGLYFMGHTAPWKNIPVKLPVTDEFLRLCGYYVAEGSALSGLQLAFGLDEADSLVVDAALCIERTFGVKPIVSRQKKKFIVLLNRTALVHVLRRWFGERATEKHLPSWLTQLPPEKQMSFLVGYWRGDGHIGNMSRRGRTLASAVASTASRELAYQLFLMLLRQRMVPHLMESINRGYKTGPIFKVAIFGRDAVRLAEKMGKVLVNEAVQKRGRVVIWHNHVLMPITRIESAPYSGKVYNLEVETCRSGSNSFVSDLRLVHNSLHSYGLQEQAVQRLTPLLVARERFPTILSRTNVRYEECHECQNHPDMFAQYGFRLVPEQGAGGYPYPDIKHYKLVMI